MVFSPVVILYARFSNDYNIWDDAGLVESTVMKGSFQLPRGCWRRNCIWWWTRQWKLRSALIREQLRRGALASTCMNAHKHTLFVSLMFDCQMLPPLQKSSSALVATINGSICAWTPTNGEDIHIVTVSSLVRSSLHVCPPSNYVSLCVRLLL